MAIPTVRVLRSVSGVDEEVFEEAEALLGCERLRALPLLRLRLEREAKLLLELT